MGNKKNFIAIQVSALIKVAATEGVLSMFNIATQEDFEPEAIRDAVDYIYKVDDSSEDHLD